MINFSLLNVPKALHFGRKIYKRILEAYAITIIEGEFLLRHLNKISTMKVLFTV